MVATALAAAIVFALLAVAGGVFAVAIGVVHGLGWRVDQPLAAIGIAYATVAFFGMVAVAERPLAEMIAINPGLLAIVVLGLTAPGIVGAIVLARRGRLRWPARGRAPPG